MINKSINDITFHDIANASNHGDPLACDVLVSAASVLSCGLTNYINLVNPDMVIISGRVPSLSKIFIETVISNSRARLSLYPPNTDIQIKYIDYSVQIPSICSAVTFFEEMISL